MKRTRLVVALIVVALSSASFAWAQGGNPPASTKESGATSGHGMTAAEQTGKDGGNVEQQIKTINDQGKQAALKGDAAYLEKYYADDFVGIAGTTGKLITKPEAIERRKSGKVKYESIDERDVRVRVYGNTAILNSAATVKATSDGKPISGDYRGTWVYVKQHGQWKIVSGQSTPIKAENK